MNLDLPMFFSCVFSYGIHTKKEVFPCHTWAVRDCTESAVQSKSKMGRKVKMREKWDQGNKSAWRWALRFCSECSGLRSARLCLWLWVPSWASHTLDLRGSSQRPRRLWTLAPWGNCKSPRGLFPAFEPSQSRPRSLVPEPATSPQPEPAVPPGLWAGSTLSAALSSSISSGCPMSEDTTGKCLYFLAAEDGWSYVCVRGPGLLQSYWSITTTGACFVTWHFTVIVSFANGLFAEHLKIRA